MEGITMKEGIMIGELCRLAECTPRTIRHYEAEGLLAPISQTPGSRKLYDKETVSLVRTIRLLKRLGYSLKDIRSIISLALGDLHNRSPLRLGEIVRLGHCHPSYCSRSARVALRAEMIRIALGRPVHDTISRRPR